jgi:hypothetical protein
VKAIVLFSDRTKVTSSPVWARAEDPDIGKDDMGEFIRSLLLHLPVLKASQTVRGQLP